MQEAQGPFGQSETKEPLGPTASSSATAAAADAAPDPFAAQFASPSSPTGHAGADLTLTIPAGDAALSNGHDSHLDGGDAEDEQDGNGWEGFDDLTATSPGSPKALIGGKVLSDAHLLHPSQHAVADASCSAQAAGQSRMPFFGSALLMLALQMDLHDQHAAPYFCTSSAAEMSCLLS